MSGFQRLNELVAVGMPEPAGAVGATGGKHITVLVERDAGYDTGVTG
jgi:hypothetical protein